ncbi:hypothetical protein CONLIGDRAFT_411218 [Coniochaeta ligniaria NRRL 30616]|uniref:Uncharacterized protein n=1 Tax=Coniochaeta ligniaria NRRL 30616 TaxID=1408157 RepID=A0A1J7JIV7_9PEZI|nr:hypothetical protein CONLIGDRAFT_411218 [Coniochaeta ligniaria NRRL 30616]
MYWMMFVCCYFAVYCVKYMSAAFLVPKLEVVRGNPSISVSQSALFKSTPVPCGYLSTFRAGQNTISLCYQQRL